MLLYRPAAIQVLQVVAGDAEAFLPSVQDVRRQDVLVGVLEYPFQLAVVIPHVLWKGK